MNVIRIKRRQRSGELASAQMIETPPPSRIVRQVNFTGTDDWAGEQLAKHLKGRAYWLDREGAWIIWNCKKWDTGADSLLIHEATTCAKKLAIDGIEGDTKDVVNTIKRRLSAGGVEAALKMARPHLRGDDVEWNPDRHLLNCQNGIVDLKTGRLMPHDPARHMTMITSVPYEPSLKPENFLATLEKFQPDEVVREYLHRQYGYRATGEVGDRAFFCQLGEGSNGKSTIENQVAKTLGEYHAEAAGGLFLQALNATFAKDPSGHSEALFALRYKRNVLLKEPDERHRLDESLLKQFTDGQNAVYRSRTLHKEGVNTPVTQKIVFYSNNPPRMSAHRSITNRLHAVVWPVSLTKEEENPNFPEIFLAPERSGILAWIVQGAMKFYAEGAKLGRPSFLAAGEEEYRKGSDPLGDFIEQFILREGKGLTFATFYDRYKEFCTRKGAKPTGANGMGRAMERHDLKIVVYHQDQRHPVTGAVLAKELRWVPGVQYVDQ